MAEKDFNHPSVIFYSLGNEIPEISTEHGAALQRKMYRFLRDVDSTRYILSSVNGIFASGDDIGAIVADVLSAAGDTGGNVNNFMQAMDVHLDAIVTHPIVSRNLERAAAGMDLIGYNYMFLMRGDGTPYDLVYNAVGGSPVLYPLCVVGMFLLYIALFYRVVYLLRRKP